MNTKTSTLNKLSTLYSMLIVFFVSATLNAQIVYTDIPDATPNATYPLDLNNDGTVDFMLQFGGAVGNVGILCYPQQNNAYAGNVVGSDYLAWALTSSTSICDSLSSWYGTNYPGTLGVGSSTGYWPGATDRHLALKLVVGANTYFGWVRLDVYPTSTSFTVKDYAYNSTPNACIQAGQTTLGLEESNEAALSVFPNPFSSSTTIQTAGNLNDATLIISNAYGQTVKRFEHLTGQSITISRGDLPNGLYFFRLDEGEVIVVVVD